MRCLLVLNLGQSAQVVLENRTIVFLNAEGGHPDLDHSRCIARWTIDATQVKDLFNVATAAPILDPNLPPDNARLNDDFHHQPDNTVCKVYREIADEIGEQFTGLDAVGFELFVDYWRRHGASIKIDPRVPV